MSHRQIVDTVWKFLDRAGDLYGRMQAERFRHEMHTDCLEHGLESPIEDLFLIAFMTMAASECEDVNQSPDLVGGQVVYPYGLYIQPQAKVGKYRVDFLVSRVSSPLGKAFSPVIVELDGHDYHDKDKRQRAYEKARDRFMVKEGYAVLHFTGSEVVADPFKAAHEVLGLLGAVSESTYDPSNPIGIE